MITSKKTKGRTLVLQIGKFLVVGLLNTGITMLVIWLLNRALPSSDFWAQIAYAIGYAAGVVFSYFTNKAWTFQSKSKRTAREFLLFVLVNLASWGVSQGVLYLLLTYAGVTDAWIATWCPAFLLGILTREYLCQILAMPSALVINFVGSRWLVFRGSAEGRVQSAE